MFKEGITAYVGRGIFDHQFVPGRIQVVQPTGLYHPSAWSIHRIVDSAEYLVNNPSQSYEWIDTKNGDAVEGAVIPGYTPGRNLWYIARVQIGDFTYLGKTHQGSNAHYEDGNAKEVPINHYQVLTCSIKSEDSLETSYAVNRIP